MIQSKRVLIIALAFPILALAALAAYKRSILTYGKEVVLPISGYDPRDLLSGHYITYLIEYGVPDQCHAGTDSEGYLCLEPKGFTYAMNENCQLVIKGFCNKYRFEAGIEKFFVPEFEAKRLESEIRSKPASIVLSITKDGRAQVKDLLINGKSWK